MRQEKKPIRIAIGENLWTRALVAGSGEVQRNTIEKLMDYLQADGLLRRRFTVEELFPLAGRR
jgi:hypothetical protein